MSFLYDVTCYTYEEAVSTFGDELPSVDQIGELKVECTWEWQKNVGYKVTVRAARTYTPTIVASPSPFVSFKIDGGEEV